MVTFIDRKHVKPIKSRGKDTFGRTYRLAGFNLVGETKGKLLAFQLVPGDIPEACTPIGVVQSQHGTSPELAEKVKALFGRDLS